MEATIGGLVQPCALPSTTPQTTRQQAEADEHQAGQVELVRRTAALTRVAASPNGSSTRPMGTLSQKIQCHEMPSTMAPPTRGPRATASPPTAPQAPSATPRRSAGTAALSRVRVRGTTMAPPAPWRARAMMSVSMLVDIAASAEAAVKMARPMTNSRRRPKRSPSAAPVSSSTAKVRV